MPRGSGILITLEMLQHGWLLSFFRGCASSLRAGTGVGLRGVGWGEERREPIGLDMVLSTMPRMHSILHGCRQALGAHTCMPYVLSHTQPQEEERRLSVHDVGMGIQFWRRRFVYPPHVHHVNPALKSVFVAGGNVTGHVAAQLVSRRQR